MCSRCPNYLGWHLSSENSLGSIFHSLSPKFLVTLARKIFFSIYSRYTIRDACWKRGEEGQQGHMPHPPFWPHFGPILAPFWPHFGPILAPLECTLTSRSPRTSLHNLYSLIIFSSWLYPKYVFYVCTIKVMYHNIMIIFLTYQLCESFGQTIS